MSTPRRSQCNVRLDPEIIEGADADRATIGERGISRDAYTAAALVFYRQHRTREPSQADLAEIEALAARIRGGTQLVDEE